MSHGGQSGMRAHTCSSGVICTPHCFQRLATVLQYTSNHTLSCDWDLSVSENLLAEVTELFFQKGSKPAFIRGIGTTRHLCINCRAMRICAFPGMMDPVAEVTEFLLRQRSEPSLTPRDPTRSQQWDVHVTGALQTVRGVVFDLFSEVIGHRVGGEKETICTPGQLES
jgi:hypothetical protein